MQRKTFKQLFGILALFSLSLGVYKSVFLKEANVLPVTSFASESEQECNCTNLTAKHGHKLHGLFAGNPTDTYVRITEKDVSQHSKMSGKQCHKEKRRGFDLHRQHLPEKLVNATPGIFQLGGHWIPPNSQRNKSKTAIIIPFKDRESHLSTWLWYMIPFLQEQEIAFTVFVVEYANDGVFNKGSVFNAGFLEVKKLGHFDCIILHDVDMMAENSCNLYRCEPNTVVHLGAVVDTLHYKLMYWTLLGGVLAMEPHIYEDVNGFTNAFYGWGGEDDEFSERLKIRRYPASRSNRSIGRYTMIRHTRKDVMERGGKGSEDHARKWWSCDGLNSINNTYTVQSIKLLPLYTRIIVKMNNTVPKTLKEAKDSYQNNFAVLHSYCYKKDKLFFL